LAAGVGFANANVPIEQVPGALNSLAPQQAGGAFGGILNPPGVAEQKPVYLGGTATESDMLKLEQLRENPSMVADYLRNQMGLEGAALNRALNNFYSDDLFRRRTYDNPTGSFFSFDTGVSPTGEVERSLFGNILDFFTGDDLPVSRGGQPMGTRRDLRSRRGR
jgi:hypothetical protein